MQKKKGGWDFDRQDGDSNILVLGSLVWDLKG